MRVIVGIVCSPPLGTFCEAFAVRKLLHSVQSHAVTHNLPSSRTLFELMLYCAFALSGCDGDEGVFLSNALLLGYGLIRLSA